MDQPRRWIAQPIDNPNPDDAGSIYACGKHAREHAEHQGMTLGECMGSEGVDALTYCPLCPQ